MCKDIYLEEIPKAMVERLDTYDIVIGSSFLRSSHVSRKPARRLVSAIDRLMVRPVLPNRRITDTDLRP